VVTQLYGEWRPGTLWEMEIWFDAGYAVPELRGDENAPAPQRDWLVNMGEAGWKSLRSEAERYLRDSLVIYRHGEVLEWKVLFPDFETTPPDFPVRMNGGAYFRMRLSAGQPASSALQLKWIDGDRPALVLRLPGDEASYLTFEPGESRELQKSGQLPWLETFRQGFRHVLPDGLDHVLFVLGLFFYRRAWRPLVAQSLAFTAAHTVTLGLAAAGWVRISGNWVEPMIALSLVAIALENLRQQKEQSQWPRLAIIFGFGLIHGLGFAGALSAWLQPGEGFLTALISANIGVESAQVTLLTIAWLLTLCWHGTAAFQRVRVAGCLSIAGIGGFWMLERTGFIG
jgi:HupE / UreJ protein